jgi:hypothetical protein
MPRPVRISGGAGQQNQHQHQHQQQQQQQQHHQQQQSSMGTPTNYEDLPQHGGYSTEGLGGVSENYQVRPAANTPMRPAGSGRGDTQDLFVGDGLMRNVAQLPGAAPAVVHAAAAVEQLRHEFAVLWNRYHFKPDTSPITHGLVTSEPSPSPTGSMPLSAKPRP